MVSEVDAFLYECPASPISHLMEGGRGLVTQSKPFEVTVYVTRACNLSCRHCYISAGSPLSNELTTEEWGKVFRELGELGVEQLYILGGEPMMRRDIFDIITLARKYMSNAKIAMSTNGTLINRERALLLKRSGLDEVQVSLDGPTREVNDSIRIPGSFIKALMAVKYLKEVGLRVTLAYVVMDENAEYVEDAIRLVEDLGVDGINFQPVVPFGRAVVNGLKLSRPLGYETLTRITKIKSRVNVTVNGFRFYINDLDSAYRASLKFLGDEAAYYRTCPAGTSRFIIDANGDVYACELFIPLLKEGNVRERSLRDIWLNGFREFRSRDISKVSPCNKCQFVYLCRGGCLARAYSRFKSLLSPDPACPFVNLNS